MIDQSTVAAMSGAPGAPSPVATVSRLRRLLERERGGRPTFGRPPRGVRLRTGDYAFAGTTSGS